MPPDDDEDWVGEPPEGHYTAERARPEFWRGQRPPQLVAGALVVVLVVVVLVLLVR